MGLANEAAYLYVFSKKLVKINRELSKLSGKAEKHRTNHSKAKDEEDRNKHQKRHSNVREDISKLMKEHNTIIKKLRHHQVAFAHSLQKEHHIK